jgi:hypothetical protein
MKKIDVFYNDSKGNTIYLFSTNMCKRCKDAIDRFFLNISKYPSVRFTYYNRAGETINPKKVFARFDHGKS